MRKRAHHRGLQHHAIMCVIFNSKLIFEVSFLGVFICVPGYSYKVFEEDFYSFVNHFWCVSDVALKWNKCLTTIEQTKKWFTSPDPIEAFHVEISLTTLTKVFAAGNFLCPAENLLLESFWRRILFCTLVIEKVWVFDRRVRLSSQWEDWSFTFETSG